jgi:hypothetical protein
MRRIHNRARAAVLAAALATSLLPLTLQTQQPLKPVEVAAERERLENARADALDEQARALYPHPHRYVDAARLHRRAALIRGQDPRAVTSFRSAAWLYSVAGMHGTARQMMELAADRAKSVGDIESAANTYIDAAFLAIADGRDDQVPGLLSRMHMVMQSPLLTADRRATILRRIGDSPRLARLDSATRDKE